MAAMQPAGMAGIAPAGTFYVPFICADVSQHRGAEAGLMRRCHDGLPVEWRRVGADDWFFRDRYPRVSLRSTLG